MADDYHRDLATTTDQYPQHTEISAILPYFLSAYKVATRHPGHPIDGFTTVEVEARRRGPQSPPHFYVLGHEMQLHSASGREKTPGLFVEDELDQMLDGDELCFFAPPGGRPGATRDHRKYIIRLERSDERTQVAWWKFVEVDDDELHETGAVLALCASGSVIRQSFERSLAKRSGYQACRERAIQAGMALTRTSRYG